MLTRSTRLTDFPVLSLHLGSRIARLVAPIVDPNDLKIIAYRVDGPLVGREYGDILPTSSVREHSPIGFIIDSSDELVAADDIVRVRDILKLHFNLIGLKVVTKRGTKLGKVIDYTIDLDSGLIQQLIVQRPPLKAFIDPELTISRSQILEVTDYEVKVKDEEEKIRRVAQSEFVPSFINPFREPDYATEPSAAEPSAARPSAASPELPASPSAAPLARSSTTESSASSSTTDRTTS